jgi:hypothetical protein
MGLRAGLTQGNQRAAFGNRGSVSTHLVIYSHTEKSLGEDMNEILEKRDTDKDISSDYDLNIKKIVVAVDLSPHSEKTAAYAVEFARSFEASVTLMHVFPTEHITEFTTQKVHESFEGEQRATQRNYGR